MSRKHGMSRGSSWPSTASRAMCWWSTGTDGVNAPTIAADLRRPDAAGVHDGLGLDPAVRRLDARAPRGPGRAGSRSPACACGCRRRGRGRRRRARRWRCAGRRSRRRPPRPRRAATPALACGMSASACFGPTTSTSRPIPRARLAPRRSSIRLSLLDAIRRLPEPLEHAELLVELDAVAAEPHHRRRGVELGDEAGGVAGRAARQLALLEQDDVGPARLGQVVGDAAPGDAAADDDDSGSVTLHVCPARSTGPDHSEAGDYSGAAMFGPRRSPRSRPRAARAPVGGGARRRPDEHELQGRDPRGRLRRARLRQGRRAARNRPRERVPEHRSPPPTPASGRRSSTTCPSARCSSSSSSRARRRRPRTCSAATGSTGSPPPAGACTARAAFRDDFNMFDIQRRYLRLVQDRGFRLPDALPRVRAAGAPDRGGDGRARRGQRCRATTTSWPRTSSTSATGSG